VIHTHTHTHTHTHNGVLATKRMKLCHPQENGSQHGDHHIEKDKTSSKSQISHVFTHVESRPTMIH
jgi:hypothetical protein